MQRRYRDHARFLTIYIKEAHPTDEWQMDSNEEQQICYPQPRSTEARIAIAADFVERFRYEIPMLIDPIENPANEAYAAWPERLYVVDEGGRIAYKGGMGPFGFHPDEVEAWLAQRFPGVPPAPAAAQGDARR
jgi:hypothetical protein